MYQPGKRLRLAGNLERRAAVYGIPADRKFRVGYAVHKEAHPIGLTHHADQVTTVIGEAGPAELVRARAGPAGAEHRRGGCAIDAKDRAIGGIGLAVEKGPVGRAVRVGGRVERDPGEHGEVAGHLQRAVVAKINVITAAIEPQRPTIVRFLPACADDLAMVLVAAVVPQPIALALGESVPCDECRVGWFVGDQHGSHQQRCRPNQPDSTSTHGCLFLGEWRESVDNAAAEEGGHVNFVILVLAKSDDRQAAALDRPILGDLALLRIVAERPQRSRDIVAVEIGTVELRQARSAVDASRR